MPFLYCPNSDSMVVVLVATHFGWSSRWKRYDRLCSIASVNDKRMPKPFSCWIPKVLRRWFLHNLLVQSV